MAAVLFPPDICHMDVSCPSIELYYISLTMKIMAIPLKGLYFCKEIYFLGKYMENSPFNSLLLGFIFYVKPFG